VHAAPYHLVVVEQQDPDGVLLGELRQIAHVALLPVVSPGVAPLPASSLRRSRPR
jgi:hypothetical protein